MDDLGDLLANDREYLMLGGGNPARIPAVVDEYRACMARLAADENRFFSAVGSYDAPGGAVNLVNALVKLFNETYGWGLDASNIALTNGSQNAFFLLFNMLAGQRGDSQRKILLPMTPEYIGYEDVAIQDNFFVSQKPLIDIVAEKRFKYRIDLDNLNVSDDIGAICVSRPTNPTGNVITDAELESLDQLALSRQIPLIIDNAYGEPFPDIIQSKVSLRWHPNIILSMSLSKLGLPALRTGIIIAAPEVTRTIGRMNAIINLTPGSLGPAMVSELFESGEILNLSRNHIKPFYRQKAEQALRWFDQSHEGLPAFAHSAEGSIFLWLWFKELPITANQLYQRLKQRGVIIVPGQYFFPGIDASWQHCHECIRVNYAMNDASVQQGIAIIAEEVKKAYQKT